MSDQNANRPSGFRWNLIVGPVFGLTALAVVPLLGLRISSDLFNTDGRPTWLSLFLGVTFLGVICSWLMISRPRQFSVWRGAITGILITVYAYPLVIALGEFVQRAWGAGDLPAFTDRLGQVLLATFLTLMTTGLPAAAIGAALGVGTAPLLGRVHGAWVFRPPQRPGLLQILGISLALVMVVLLSVSFFYLSNAPFRTDALATRPSPSVPAESYEQAIAAFDAIAAEEATLPLHENCHTKLLTHGRKVARTVIYFHGLTSCPAQGARLAEQLFEMGYNVYSPRMFGHGEADPMSTTLSDMRAEQLVDLANQSVDLAQGLGDEVVVIGVSAGGTLTSWTAQFRSDVDVAIPVSPFLGAYLVPPWATRAATNLILTMPNLVLWWNPLENASGSKEGFVYPRPASRPAGELMMMAQVVLDTAKTTPPAAKRIEVLVNEADILVSNALTHELVASWQANGADVQVETIPFGKYLPHDIINPLEQRADMDLVYSKIIEMMGPAPDVR